MAEGLYGPSLVPASACVGPSQLIHDHGVCKACGKRVMQCTDGRIHLQEQNTVLYCAVVNDHPDVVQILVDSKADMEAVDEVAMRPVQPGKGKG